MKHAKTLSREEMSNIMAGNPQDTKPRKVEPCKTFYEQTGCCPNFDTSGTCTGKDGVTYSNAHSCSGC